MAFKSLSLVASLATIALLGLASPSLGTAQPPKSAHYRYTLIDLGTLGGPQADVGNFPFPAENNRGLVVGQADTPLADPYLPSENPAFGGDPFVQHAFSWHDGVISDLGALGAQPGNNSSFTNAVNARGDAAGLSDNGTIDPIQGYAAADAVLWKDGRIIDLGTLGGGNESLAIGLNNRGQVVGVAANTIPDPFSMFGFSTQTRAFTWQHGVIRDLGTLGGPDAAAFFVNDRGQVAGNAYTNATANPVTGSPTTHPFLWQDGTMRDLGTLGGSVPNGGGVNALNNGGEVAGSSDLAGDQTFHPFVWNGRSLVDLGTLGGALGSAQWLNRNGAAVGWANTPEKATPLPLAEPGDQVYHAFIWKDGVMTDLGTAPGDRCAVAYGVNSRDQVVGDAGICHGAVDAFLSENGVTMNLNSLVAPSNLHLKEALSINDQGQIVGKGVLPNGDIHQYLLTPNDNSHDSVSRP
jgi:probable HAF family extracellular repeat protein